VQNADIALKVDVKINVKRPKKREFCCFWACIFARRGCRGDGVL